MPSTPSKLRMTPKLLSPPAHPHPHAPKSAQNCFVFVSVRYSTGQRPISWMAWLWTCAPSPPLAPPPPPGSIWPPDCPPRSPGRLSPVLSPALTIRGCPPSRLCPGAITALGCCVFLCSAFFSVSVQVKKTLINPQGAILCL